MGGRYLVNTCQYSFGLYLGVAETAVVDDGISTVPDIQWVVDIRILTDDAL